MLCSWLRALPAAKNLVALEQKALPLLEAVNITRHRLKTIKRPPHPTPTAQVMQTLDFVLLKCLEPFWMDHYPEPTAAQCKQKWLWSGLTQAE